MKKKTTDKDSPGKLYLPHNRIDPFVAQGSTEAGATHYWRWGDDNLFPNALALMARRSTTHRRIINDKADYVSGKGFSFNEGDPALARFIGSANGTGETLRQVFNKLAFDKALFGQIVKLGVPAGVQQALFSFGVMAMQRLINSYGSAFMAGFNGANKLDTFAFMPIQSFATAATTFVGQNIGANRPERVHKGTVATLWMSCGFSVLVAALLLPTGRFCMRLFSTEPAVIESGFAYLARILPFYWMLAIMFVLSSIMRGAGEMMVPMISSLAALWLARVPAAYLLAHFFGPMNIHFCYAIGWALGLAICVPYYFSGRWKEKSIVVRAAGGS